MTTRPRVLAVLGPTASGKSALGLALARRFDGEILNCDSTAVYRGFDIGTDKVAPDERQGIPHHLIDIADPTEVYTAAQFARDAAAVIREVHARGRLPILVGGTGFYYRALVRGLFPGPGADQALRDRLDRLAARRGPERLHRLLAHVDPASGARIMPRDQKRIVRALEVYFATGTPLTAHFAATRSLIDDCDVTAIALRLPADATAARVARRVEAQFARGVVDEVRGTARTRRAAARAPLRRARLSSDHGDAARRARRGGDARAHRAGEPSLRAAPVDLVPQRAYSYLVRRTGRVDRRAAACGRR